MKKILLTLACLLFAGIATWAQAPSLMNYQGVARNAAGSPLASTNISLRLTVHDGSATGTSVYQETHSVTTNVFGLYNVSIGAGTVVSGTFAGIAWGTGTKWVQVEIDPAGGSSYTSLGASQLLSVPYALYAAAGPGGGGVTSVTAGSGLSGGTITSTGTISMPNVGTAGTYGSATQVPVFTTDAQGRVTSVTNTAIASGGVGTVTSVGTGAGLTGGPITSSGTISLSTLGSAGTYGSATQVPVITTDAYGRVSGITLATIAGGGTITGSGTTNYMSKFTSATAIGNSQVFDNGTSVGLGTVSPAAKLHVSGSSNITITLGALTFDHQSLLAQAGAAATTMVSRAVVGYAANSSNENHGMFGAAEGSGASYNVGGFFWANPALTSGNCYGVYGSASGGLTNYGVYGNATIAGYFAGNVQITGSITKGSGTFKIDHPLDPENKYLYHSFVESPDMMNIYNGNVVTDANGDATITLPSYFEALNKDFRYQLTVIGSFAQAIVKDEVSGNTFSIKTDKPNVKVSWQVTGVRQDKFANAHRVVPEVEKEPEFKGHYLHPAEWGKPASMSIDMLTMPKSAAENMNKQSQKK